MVDAPSAALATATWEATLAKPSVGDELLEQVFNNHPMLRFLLKGEIGRREGFQTSTTRGKVSFGPKPKQFFYGATRAIERDLLVSQPVTSGAIHVEDAVTTTVDIALPANPLRKLSGDYGCIYGAMTMGLDEELRGDMTGDGYRNYQKDVVVPLIGQQMSLMLAAGFYSDGTADQIDGLAYWRRNAGAAKWNSNAMATDTFLQGQVWTCTEAQFCKAKLRTAITQARLGPVGGVNSDGHKPNVMLCTTALLDKMKGWIDDKQVINLPAATTDFIELGTPEDYIIFDGVVCFADHKLDNSISAEYGLFYLLHTADIEIFLHKRWAFSGADPLKAGGDKPEALDGIELPAYLFKIVHKKIILANFFYKRPRNLLYGTVT